MALQITQLPRRRRLADDRDEAAGQFVGKRKLARIVIKATGFLSDCNRYVPLWRSESVAQWAVIVAKIPNTAYCRPTRKNSCGLFGSGRSNVNVVWLPSGSAGMLSETSFVNSLRSVPKYTA